MELPSDIAFRRMTYAAGKAGRWTALLSEEERERLHAFGTRKRRREFLLGRAAARTLLAERLGVAPQRVPLRVAADGAVEAPGTGLCLSIAHSGTRAVAAVADGPVGADLERIQPRRAGVERFILHPDEGDLLERLPLEHACALTLCWVLKEAALKAMRTGLRLAPTKLRLDVELEAHAARIAVDEGGVWQAQFEEAGGYYLAVAFPG